MIVQSSEAVAKRSTISPLMVAAFSKRALALASFSSGLEGTLRVWS